MRHLPRLGRASRSATLASLLLAACGGPGPQVKPTSSAAPAEASAAAPAGAAREDGPPATCEAPPTPPGAAGSPSRAPATNEFVLNTSDSARKAQGVNPSKIKATRTEAAMKFFVVDKEKGPVPGVVVSLAGPDGKKYYTEETDAEGYAEVLVPVGQKYDLTYLSLGKRDIAATVTVTDEPNQNVKLTLRFKSPPPPPPPLVPTPGVPPTPRFVLKGVNFDTAKATLRPESIPRLDLVVEYLTYKKNARIEISGHTDNVGNARSNKVLSEKRAQTCRDYLIGKGIDPGRIVAVGFGDERPIASNDTDEGRQENRRIEAREL